jgi:hypothetical protein
MKIKIKKSKKSKMEEQISFLKLNFVNFKIMEDLRQSDIDKELLEFIENSFTFESIEEISEYGMDVFRLDFTKTMTRKHEDIFKFMKVDKNEYINKMKIYRDELNKSA